MNKGGMFLKKLWCCVGGRVWQVSYRSDEGLTLETSFTLYVGQITFSTQLLTLNYLICVQLRTEEMEMKGIVTNKKERDRKGVNLLLWYLFCSLFRCKTEDTNCSNNHHIWIWQHIFLCLCKDRWCRDSVSTKQEKFNFIIPDKNVFWQ